MGQIRRRKLLGYGGELIGGLILTGCGGKERESIAQEREMATSASSVLTAIPVKLSDAIILPDAITPTCSIGQRENISIPPPVPPTSTPNAEESNIYPTPAFSMARTDSQKPVRGEFFPPQEATEAPTPTIIISPSPIKTSTPTSSLVKEEEIKSLRDHFIWKGDPKKAKVALTFDDGWWSSYIKQFIEVVKKTGVRLTLFPAGQAIDAYPGLWRELFELGCEFGCHTYKHDFSSYRHEPKAIIEDINRSQQTLDKVIGQHVAYQFYRPVGGTISENIVRALQAIGLRGVIWNLSGEGTSSIATPKTVASRILSLAGNGYITLHHFIDPDVMALEEMIDGLKKKGLEPTTLTKVL